MFRLVASLFLSYRILILCFILFVLCCVVAAIRAGHETRSSGVKLTEVLFCCNSVSTLKQCSSLESPTLSCLQKHCCTKLVVKTHSYALKSHITVRPGWNQVPWMHCVFLHSFFFIAQCVYEESTDSAKRAKSCVVPSISSHCRHSWHILHADAVCLTRIRPNRRAM